ncbi:ABC transporter substrate-binding protein [Candidatus Methanocrinis alkalitolerans]|uniref:ABC transporter substrate-binding protein n=1 Tax=Candidatus Methanocrinis alkalitolerans TaxID=3033395 RepID=UPI0029340F9C|nr:ABC transporter substrate-binding protein [Candidatus Methanocrinis alkalitolerans]
MDNKTWLLARLALFTLLVTTPVNASDDVLKVYGNANMDETIDEDDIAYVEGVIKGTNEKTEFSDANYDGEVTEKDITQIKQIINGEESEITIVDSADRIVTVKKPVDRIICFHYGTTEAIQTIGASEKIVGVNRQIVEKTDFYKIEGSSNIGYVNDPDYEEILRLDPDVVFVFANVPVHQTRVENIRETLNKTDPGITVIGADFVGIERYVGELRQLGYILDKEAEAEEFIEFYNSWMEEIKGRLKDIPEDDRTKVYFEEYYPLNYNTYGEGSFGLHESVVTAGGNNIFSNHPGSFFEVDPEAVITQNPDVILKYEAGSYADAGNGFGGNAEKMDELRDEILNRSHRSSVKDRFK